MPSDLSLSQWVKTEITQHPHIRIDGDELSLKTLSGDAGFRQYFRLNTVPPLLAVAAPNTPGVSESASYFAKLAKQFRQNGIPAPQVVAHQTGEANYLLLEDMGDQLLLSRLNEDSAELLYGEALMVLLRLQQIPSTAMALPDYDASTLQEEMSLFSDWFVTELLGHSLTVDEQALIETTFNFLTQQALEQPQVLVHRDFHSRNLIYREAEAPGVIDFQDAVWGPVTYDLVSLLRDCYIRWPQEQVNHWSETYANLAFQVGIIGNVGMETWQRWFDCMGLQRHIKVLGIFSRLSLRDSKDGYLKDLPLVLRYTLEIAEQYSETKDFAHWINTTLLNKIEKQDWYQHAHVEGNLPK